MANSILVTTSTLTLEVHFITNLLLKQTVRHILTNTDKNIISLRLTTSSYAITVSIPQQMPIVNL